MYVGYALVWQTDRGPLERQTSNRGTVLHSLHPHTSDAFTLVVSDVGTTRTITPHGELDIATVASASEALVTAFADGHETVVLDLAETTFLDSTGVRLVL